MKTLETYKADMGRFGKVRFEIRASGKTNQSLKYALLNEGQATFTVTLSACLFSKVASEILKPS